MLTALALVGPALALLLLVALHRVEVWTLRGADREQRGRRDPDRPHREGE